MEKKKYIYNYTKSCSICSVEYTTTSYKSTVCSDICRKKSFKINKKYKYTEEQKQKAIDLKKMGFSSADIEKETSIKKPTQDKLFKELGIILTKDQIKKINEEHGRWRSHEPVKDNKKKCSQCLKELDVSFFNNDPNSKSGLKSACKSCESLYYQKNCVKIKERVNKYRENNKDLIKERNQKYYENNKELIVERVRLWRNKNLTKVKKYEKKYRSTHKEERVANTAAYRAAKVKATPKWLTDSQKEEIKNIYKNCPKGFHVDHIVPINGDEVCGLHVPWNLQYLPDIINETKGNTPTYLGDSKDVSTCFQKIQRDRTLEEDRELGMPFDLKVSDFSMTRESLTKEHVDFIVKYEWLGQVGYGVRHVFTARYKNLLAGVVMISEPTSYSKFNKDLEALIQRGACSSWAPKNLNSALVMFSCKWMVNNTQKRLFTAYSDPTAGEIGTIYQACNWDYLGQYFGAKIMYKLPNGKLVSSRSFTRTSSMKKWARELGIEWLREWTKENGYQDTKAIPKEILKKLRNHGMEKARSLETIQCPPKGKYCLLLGKDKREQKYLNTLKNWICLPYPKRKIT